MQNQKKKKKKKRGGKKCSLFPLQQCDHNVRQDPVNTTIKQRIGKKNMKKSLAANTNKAPITTALDWSVSITTKGILLGPNPHPMCKLYNNP